MVATVKPDLTRVWAATAPGANVEDPDTTSPGKFTAGWTAEVPPFENFNFLQQLFTQGAAHNNEQGINIWDTVTTYPVDGIAKGSDGVTYYAVLEQASNDPTADDGTNWLPTNTKLLNAEWNTKRKDMITCVPRIVAGVAELLEDVGHTSLGFDAIQQNGLYELQLDYTESYGKVNSVLVNIDNELAPYGIWCGGSVGTTNTKFTAFAQLVGTLSTTAFGATTLFKSPTDVGVSTVDDVITVTHVADAVNGESVTVTPNFPGPRIAVDVIDNFSFSVTAIVDLAGLVVRTADNTFAFAAGVPTFIAASQAGISFSWSDATGTLTVNHPNATNYDVQLVGFGGIYLPQVSSVSNGSFDVQFFDYAGTKILLDNVNMKVWIKRKMDLKGKMPAAATFEVRGPILKVRSAVLSDVGGSNFWALGSVQKA